VAPLASGAIEGGGSGDDEQMLATTGDPDDYFVRISQGED
jgi:hypothetical protein